MSISINFVTEQNHRWLIQITKYGDSLLSCMISFCSCHVCTCCLFFREEGRAIIQHSHGHLLSTIPSWRWSFHVPELWISNVHFFQLSGIVDEEEWNIVGHHKFRNSYDNTGDPSKMDETSGNLHIFHHITSLARVTRKVHNVLFACINHKNRCRFLCKLIRSVMVLLNLKKDCLRHWKREDCRDAWDIMHALWRVKSDERRTRTRFRCRNWVISRIEDPPSLFKQSNMIPAEFVLVTSLSKVLKSVLKFGKENLTKMCEFGNMYFSGYEKHILYKHVSSNIHVWPTHFPFQMCVACSSCFVFSCISMERSNFT